VHHWPCVLEQQLRVHSRSSAADTAGRTSRRVWR
jgi:hypothetical protein